MSINQLFLAGILVALLLAAGPAAGDSETLRILARITQNLEHNLTEEDKVVLKSIVDSDDSSEEEAAIAMALANMQHEVAGADAERLRDIVDDDLSDASARKLAAILLRINQNPADDDKLTLANLAGE
jgi:hypothetical protein